MATATLGLDTWRTPGGVLVQLAHRPQTSDWNTLSAILTHDEYGMPKGKTGVFLDVGAHIGGWAVGVALDNPAATVIAIEALPENASLIVHNVKRAGVEERVTVYQRAAGREGAAVEIGYGDMSTEFGRQHEFIGNAGATSNRTVSVPVITLEGVLKEAHADSIALMKIDCEGCEYPFLASPAIGQVEEIVGEVHAGWDRLVALLDATHIVTGEGKDFGSFRAVRR